jgi:hypothetical protein
MSTDAAAGVPDVFAQARLGPITPRNRTYPYEDGYLLEDARQIRAAVKLPMK